MARPAPSYLDNNEFEGNEFERSEEAFGNLTNQLSGFLHRPLAVVLREALCSDISYELLGSAEAVLRLALPGMGDLPDDVKDSAVEELAREIRSSPRLSEATIEAHILDSADELAQIILGGWFQVFYRRDGGWSSLPLNANMLPGEMSIKDLLSELALEEFGVELPVLAGCFTDFQAAMVRDEKLGVVEFGPELFLALNTSDMHHPFTAFDTYAKALTATARTKLTSAPKKLRAKVSTILNTSRPDPGKAYALITEAVWSGAFPKIVLPGSSMGRMAKAMLAIGANVSRTDEKWLSPISGKSHLYEPGMTLLNQSVTVGLDAFSAGMAVDSARAQERLREESANINEWLDGYAKSHEIEPQTARELFAGLVARGVTYRYAGSLSTMASVEGDEVYMILKNDFGVSGPTATDIAKDASASVAHFSAITN
jgi:hypothetical protein